MEKVMAEDGVLSMAKDVELAFWADEKEREHYFQHQLRLLVEYSDKHTFEILLSQEREKAEQEREKAEQERERAEQAELDKEKAVQNAQATLVDVARSMLADGIPVAAIQKYTGLDEKTITEQEVIRHTGGL
jgi:hypothetical protein